MKEKIIKQKRINQTVYTIIQERFANLEIYDIQHIVNILQGTGKSFVVEKSSLPELIKTLQQIEKEGK